MPASHAAQGGYGAAQAALAHLHDRLGSLELPYELGMTAGAAARAALLRDQLGDYVLPRLASLDAPLLAVVGGSTGAGKSTLVNSLVRRRVAAASAIRPTTRRPLLLHAPQDREWFDSPRVLGSLARVRVNADAPAARAQHVTAREVEMRPCDALPAGLALLDAPDVDSVVEDNRSLAAALLAAADLWLFVTTAARYADAVPWEHLRAAADRDIVAAVVLNRVPPGAAGQVETDLRRRLDRAGLDHAPVLTLPETGLDDEGLLPAGVVAPVRAWLYSLSADRSARREVALRTVTGALGAVVAETGLLVAQLDAQETQREELARAARGAYAEARAAVERATADGAMLRGEVLARWQELVGTGELWRGLESWVGRVRDRVTAALRGGPGRTADLEEAIESSLAGLLVAESQRAALDAERAWRRTATAPRQLAVATAALPDDDQLAARAAGLVRDWQSNVLELVRAEGADKRLRARILSLGVNVVGVALMVLVFAHTGGLTGGEVGIAGGTALLAQRVLEAVFGDQAMRRLAERARADLLDRCTVLLDDQCGAFIGALDPPAPTGAELRDDLERVRTALGGHRPADTGEDR
ncbi:MAG: dynamin family protein [Actinomyces sp.]|uniref:dynamin family protein n=1 Tax=Actinomyces sp. TaxID=29317 RepID=UPI0026DB8BBD|nr:dynamin family protein [Actinomyces sp.]MDO4244325.1 dynamin family protein [Actinomyces sp.]